MRYMVHRVKLLADRQGCSGAYTKQLYTAAVLVVGGDHFNQAWCLLCQQPKGPQKPEQLHNNCTLLPLPKPLGLLELVCLAR
jgi:hypothetical protein